MNSSSFVRGTQLFEVQKYNDAIKYFKTDLTENPNSYISKYYLGLCYLNLKDYDNAESIVTSILASHPDFSNAHYLNSILKFNLSDYKMALEFIDNAIRIDPYDADYFGHKALILLNLKKNEEALEAANEGLKLDPKNVNSLNTRTKALTKLKRKEEAFETLYNTLNDHPEDDFTHANAGWTNLEIGNHKVAKNHFKEALRKDPNNEYARQGMVEAIKSQNIIYRGFLKYAFWIQNKSSKSQWGIIIGIYLAYRFSYVLLKNSSFSFIAPVLVVLYLLFAFGSWLISPISNAILLFNNYGKYLLDKKDKWSGLILITLSSISIISITLFYLTNNESFLTISLASLFSILPMTHSMQFSNKNSTLISFSYGSLMLSIGFINALFLGNNLLYSGIIFIMLIAYTWLSNILKE